MYKLYKYGKIYLKKGVDIMKISMIIGENIKNLMKKQDISYRKLSEAIGISHPTLKKYVDGDQPIDSQKLMQIALYFNKSFDYFIKQEHDDMQFMFRADKPNKDVQNIDLVNLRIAINSYLDIIGNDKFQYITQKYYINLNDFKERENEVYKLVEKIAYEQRRITGIENVIPNNYFEILTNLGINVIVRDFKNDSYFGASSYSNKKGSFILINDSTNISEERKIFSLLHEYAHLLFHSDQYTNDDFNAFYVSGKYDLHEKLANKFAGYFLLPRYLVNAYLESRDNVDVIEMKKHFKVSIQTLYLMLYEYNLISKSSYTDFWKKINVLGYKKTEPNPIDKSDFEEKNSRLIKHIKDLFFKEEISANKVSEVLGLDILDTRIMLKEWRTTDERYLSLK